MLTVLDKSALNPACRALARAFMDYPLFRYCTPDTAQREKTLHKFFEMMMRGVLLDGDVYATSKRCEGVAMWLKPEHAYFTTLQTVRVFLAHPSFLKVGLGPMMRGMKVENWMTRLRKELVPFPHRYLYVMGVDTPHQGQGRASALLRPVVSQCDRDDRPCFLETYHARNVPLYEHLGFQVIKASTVPGTDLPYWAMFRKPMPAHVTISPWSQPSSAPQYIMPQAHPAVPLPISEN